VVGNFPTSHLQKCGYTSYACYFIFYYVKEGYAMQKM